MMFRQDYGGELQSPRRNADGSMTYSGRAADLGKLTYVQPDGSIHVEFRQPRELKNICDGVKGVPVTFDHPGAMLHSSEQGWDRVVGVVTDARVEGDAVNVDVQVWNKDAQAAIERGALPDFSLGYECDLLGSGEQVNVNPDHLALVPRGRCRACSIKTDSAAAHTCALRDDSCECGGTCTRCSERTTQMDDEYTAQQKSRRRMHTMHRHRCVDGYTKAMAEGQPAEPTAFDAPQVDQSAPAAPEPRWTHRR